MASVMTIVDYLDSNFAKWKPWGHVTSLKVTNIFLLIIASRRKELQHRPWVSLCLAHQNALNDIHVDIEVRLRSRELRSTVTLDPMRSSYTYLLRCVLTRGWYWWYCYFCSSSVSFALSSSVAIFFFTPVTPFLPYLKLTLVKLVDLVRPYPMPFTACL